MFRTIATGVSLLLLLCLSQTAQATVLTTCPDCDGGLFAITFHLDSDNGTTSIFDVTLLADTSGNSLGPAHINAVAIGLNGVTVEALMDAAPNGAGNWTGQGGGISSGVGGGCNGSGAFICAMANSSAFAALAPNASTATTPYEWTWDVEVPDSTPGGAASVFSSQGDVKVNYSEFNGHHVSDLFTFADASPRTEVVPEPITSALVGAGLIGFFFLGRRAARKRAKI
jgi:hypothetical protein